jgi:anti-sigma factor RsiW
MTNDELLALYLDNALSKTERQELEVRLQSSPELKQEAKELDAIQNMLFLPAKEDATSFAFLRGVEENIAASLLASGAAATTGAVISATSIKTGASAVASVAAKTAAGTSVATSAVATGAAAGAGGASVGVGAMWTSLVASVSSSVVGASLAAATVIGSGAAVYYTVISPSAVEKTVQQQTQTPTSQSQALIESKQNQISQEQPSSLSPSPTASSAVSTTSPAEKPTTTSNNAGNTAREPQSSEEYSARISGGSSIQGRFAASIEEYTRQVQEKEAAGDATVLREAAQFSESRKHLQKALNAAQKLDMKELEGEVRGEQGLLFLAEGKSTQAEQALREAVSILTTQQSRSTARWQRELEKITSK